MPNCTGSETEPRFSDRNTYGTIRLPDQTAQGQPLSLTARNEKRRAHDNPLQFSHSQYAPPVFRSLIVDHSTAESMDEYQHHLHDIQSRLRLARPQGGQIDVGMTWAIRSSIPSRFKPATARTMASYRPESSFCKRVLTFPSQVFQLQMRIARFYLALSSSNYRFRRLAPSGNSSRQLNLFETRASPGILSGTINRDVQPFGKFDCDILHRMNGQINLPVQ